MALVVRGKGLCQFSTSSFGLWLLHVYDYLRFCFLVFGFFSKLLMMSDGLVSVPDVCWCVCVCVFGVFLLGDGWGRFCFRTSWTY